MISSNEFYYLNKMLDGKEIYGIVNKENGGIENSKQTLIQKRILDKDGKLTKLASDIVKNLDKYKRAKEYIWINESIVSIDKTDDVVYLRKNRGDDYSFRIMSKSSILDSTLSNYNFLLREDYDVEEESEKMTIKVFLATILSEQNMQDILYVKKEHQKIQCIYNIYYECNNIIYKYDVIEKLVSKMSPGKIRQELLDIFYSNKRCL